MPQVSVKITNLPQIKRAFNRAPYLMAKELNEAIHKSVFAIGRDSRQNTPVDTGRLRASHREAFSSLRGEIGTHVEYDIFVHQGTRYMKARPYLLQAVKSNQERVQGFFTEAVQRVLDSIGRDV